MNDIDYFLAEFLLYWYKDTGTWDTDPGTGILYNAAVTYEATFKKVVKNRNGGHFGIRHSIYTLSIPIRLFQLTNFRLHCIERVNISRNVI